MEENKYTFEAFTQSKGKFAPKISLVKPGGFGFSSGFVNRYDLKGKVGVKILYDKTRNAVAFKFLDQPEEGMVKLKIADMGGYISAISFLGKYGIAVSDYSGRYDPKEIKDGSFGDLFVIELVKQGV